MSDLKEPTTAMANYPSKRPAWKIIGAILRQRCPRCLEGRIFRGRFAMNDPCPCCNLIFQREEGYFLGALYISYPLSLMILVPLFFAANALLPNWNSFLVVLVTVLPYLPLMPAVFRYSRVLWIHFDRWGDPYGSMAGTYEKMRLRELEERKRL
jgi:uncharacterized protein (DUF983 family)